MENKEFLERLAKCMFPRIFGGTLLPRIQCIREGKESLVNCLFPRATCIRELWREYKEEEK